MRMKKWDIKMRRGGDNISHRQDMLTIVNRATSRKVTFTVFQQLAVNAQDIDEVVKSSGYDFVTSSIERRAFACKLTGKTCKPHYEII